MAHYSPIGLLSIRDQKGKVVRTAVFQFYQNAVDYLSSYAQPRDWKKTGSDKYETKTGHEVSVIMMVPDGIDLTKERYLDDQEGQETKETTIRAGRKG